MSITAPRSPGTLDCLFDVTQAILTEENLVADKESRRAERAARHRLIGVAQQTFFDHGILYASEGTRPVEPRGVERRADLVGIVHLLRFLPHMVEYSLDVARQDAVDFGNNGAA